MLITDQVATAPCTDPIQEAVEKEKIYDRLFSHWLQRL